ncbi:MAG: lipase family protein [Pseudobacteriovorax sp.]|nr:lipase family protein [Pseudobacteriovorax sp.]
MLGKLPFKLLCLAAAVIPMTQTAQSATCKRIRPLFKPATNSPILEKRYQKNLAETRDAMALLAFSTYKNSEYGLPGEFGVKSDLIKDAKPLPDGTGFVFTYQLTSGTATRPAKEAQIVAFRETFTNADWADNASFFLTIPTPDNRYGLAHRGFYRSALRMKDLLVGTEDTPGLLDKDPNKPIYLTGHSRGGALAVLVGNMLIRERGIVPSAVFTFGAPKVGDKDYTDFIFDSRLKDRIHTTNTIGDAAPLTPPDARLTKLLSEQEGGFLNELRKQGYGFLVSVMMSQSKKFAFQREFYDIIPAGQISDGDRCILAVSKLVGDYVRENGIDLPDLDADAGGRWRSILAQIDFLSVQDDLDACREYHTDAYLRELDMTNKVVCGI